MHIKLHLPAVVYVSRWDDYRPKQDGALLSFGTEGPRLSLTEEITSG